MGHEQKGKGRKFFLCFPPLKKTQNNPGIAICQNEKRNHFSLPPWGLSHFYFTSTSKQELPGQEAEQRPKAKAGLLIWGRFGSNQWIWCEFELLEPDSVSELCLSHSLGCLHSAAHRLERLKRDWVHPCPSKLVPVWSTDGSWPPAHPFPSHLPSTVSKIAPSSPFFRVTCTSQLFGEIIKSSKI